jgi:preprotein translocase subunit SecE
MGCAVTLTSSAVYVNTVTSRNVQTYTVLVMLVCVFLIMILIVIHRHFGNLPADLDRVGSELNLFAYGVAVTLLLGIFLDVALLPRFPSKSSGAFFLVVGMFFLFNLYAYGFNAKFSNRLRSSPPLEDGINTFADIRHVMHSREKLFLLIISWMLGLVPTVACFAAQIFWG